MAGAGGPDGTARHVARGRNGIVFDALDGALVALDARSGRLLWSSARRSAGGNIGLVSWESPVVVDGWVDCSDQDGKPTPYALT